jgi:predicted alpha/beta-hydrolase family hydrolase
MHRVYFPVAERPESKASAQRSPYSAWVAGLKVETPHGPARVHLQRAGAQAAAGGKRARGRTGGAAAQAGARAADTPRAALVLGHGAGGGVGSRDLTKVTAVATAAGLTVALVEQPYRVAGRRSPAPAAQLDAAWLAVVDRLRTDELEGLPLIVGGRSSGARVACRTAAQSGAIAVLCLAFPVHPPGRPDKTRLPELDAVEVPTLVVQGASDPFGMPPSAPNRDVVAVKGNHSLAADLPAIGAAVEAWLGRLLAARRAA